MFKWLRTLFGIEEPKPKKKKLTLQYTTRFVKANKTYEKKTNYYSDGSNDYTILPIIVDNTSSSDSNTQADSPANFSGFGGGHTEGGGASSSWDTPSSDSSSHSSGHSHSCSSSHSSDSSSHSSSCSSSSGHSSCSSSSSCSSGSSCGSSCGSSGGGD